MANEKLQALAEDKDFNVKLENAATEQEAETILKEYGVYNEVMESASSSEELSEEQLTGITGGVVKSGLGYKAVCPVCGTQSRKTYLTKIYAQYEEHNMSARHAKGFQGINRSSSVH